jgi:hypothetical protein
MTVEEGTAMVVGSRWQYQVDDTLIAHKMELCRKKQYINPCVENLGQYAK